MAKKKVTQEVLAKLDERTRKLVTEASDGEALLAQIMKTQKLKLAVSFGPNSSEDQREFYRITGAGSADCTSAGRISTLTANVPATLTVAGLLKLAKLQSVSSIIAKKKSGEDTQREWIP